MAEHGGARSGAGRKPKPKVDLAATTRMASTVLATKPDEKTGWPGEQPRWLELLNAKDERLRFDVIKYLTDRRDGKPAQGVFVGDTRETARDLDFGDLPNITAGEPGAAGKPN